jgi:hypothetical protein
MKQVQTRLCIYPKDVQRITGKSESYSRLLLKKIRIFFNKESHQFVTIEEFSEYTGINKQKIIEFL